MDSSYDTRVPCWARTRANGFTLIELMVAVAIVAILTAIAVPSYSLFMKKSRRGSAEAALMDIAQREQQYLLDARAYAPDVVTLNATVPSDVSAFYNIAINAPAGAVPPSFTVSATPIAGSVQAGDYTLTLDNTGVRSPASVW